MPRARPHSSSARPVAASSFRPEDRSCSPVRFATRTTGSTTWRPTARSPCGATATCCWDLRPSFAAAALVAALALVAGWNVYAYPSGAGYDVRQHREYADLLIHHGQIPGPESRSEYYTPPV